ncbi:regulatory Fis family protein [Pseudonocardia hierapolitana]|uniref:Regulatory Fis family protein n=1 Tax=Pseudonocardia hierapolitana TaxID=1128676 RepID=A0A561T039_9PSEU|nr:GAF domain-containing protein [Pseudonocardia hierapolitana]TWF80480.1 regulatory Fis family protein [Pseudonocardia hierapolitana]
MDGEAQLAERELIARERGGAVPVSSRLTASWRRSAGYGVSLDAVNPVFAGQVDDGSLFFECGQEVLRGLHATLADEPVSLMLTDSAGLVLSRMCNDTTLLRALDRVYLAPGFAFSEREAGTNGLGLALADRAPSLVRADEHYCTGLWGYTCAAVPVADLATGQLLGSVNLTTWSRQADNLLLALAQMAAGHTAALVQARSRGARPRPAPRGEVFRVAPAEPDEPSPALSAAWRDPLDTVVAALQAGRGVAVVGEPGAGKAALLAAAHRRVRPHDRLLTARPPAPGDSESWLALWTPELGKESTSVVVGRVDTLSSWAAAELAAILERVGRRAFALTAEDPAAIPAALQQLVDEVVEVPPLRYRPDDVLPLARWFARRARGRDVRFSPDAARALTTYHWPGNATQLQRVVREAVTRGDVVDPRHLPAEVFSGATRRLTRIETIERDEIVRCLVEPGTTVGRAAAELGMSRATIYRKIAQYGIRIPGRG